ncbi:hypothetical protein K456DRAFT_1746475 [Colletotrichum gloeosporioides 23]|nr:hypothetical protein K456DRAFT_1746475 [Colletotrichum gloeosporioides 23]
MGRTDHLQEHKLIKMSTSAVFFMGTPHQGGDEAGVSDLEVLTRVLSLVSYTNPALIDKIKPNSPWLFELQERYNSISRDFRTVCGYELRAMAIPLRGRLLVVPKASAVLFAATDVPALAFDADHATMVKFGGDDDPNFQKIIKRIQLFSRLALDDLASSGATRSDENSIEDTSDSRTPIEFSLGVTFRGRWNRHFTGRSSTLQLLRRMLTSSSSTQDSVPLVVLYGPGGIGKTQLALEYARRGQTQYSSIFRIDGTRPDTIETSIKAFLERLKKHYVYHELHNTSPRYGIINGSSNTASTMSGSSTDRFLTWLSYKENTEWLLIIDNVDDLENVNLRDLLPTTTLGAVLVTSRRSDLAISWDSIEVLGMDKVEALALLQQSSNLNLTHDTEASVSPSRNKPGRRAHRNATI